jgi:hypothetical protein
MTAREEVLWLAKECGWELDKPLDDNRDSFHHFEPNAKPELAVFVWDESGEHCQGIFFDDQPVTNDYVRDGEIDAFGLSFGMDIRMARE